LNKLLKKPGLIMAAALAVALAITLIVPSITLARAGGGDRFPGGGSPGGGGWDGGGDDGLIYLIFYVIFSRLPWPLKIIFIVIILGVGWGVKRRRKFAGPGRAAAGGFQGSYSSGSYSAPAPSVSPSLPDQLADLKTRDPNFSEQMFEDTVSTAFFKIQEAWSKKDMSIARAFLSPSLLQRFESQINEFKKKGWTNHMEQLTVGSVDIVEAFHDGGYDYLTARINAAAVDYTVENRSGLLVHGTREIRPFTEYWTLLRSDSVKTEANKELILSKHCPNCGAPASVNAVGKCDYCGSELTSGRFSWVLSEITQASAWKPRVQAPPRPAQISPLAGERYVLGLVQCPNCGANVQDVAGVTAERCWRCGSTVPTQS
jgi:hypothetical protein